MATRIYTQVECGSCHVRFPNAKNVEDAIERDRLGTADQGTNVFPAPPVKCPSCGRPTR